MTLGHGGDGFLPSYYSANRLWKAIDAIRNQRNQREQTLKDLLNFNEACETAIAVCNKVVEEQSVCLKWANAWGGINDTLRSARVCGGESARLLIST